MRNKRRLIGVLALWSVFIVLFVEEARSLIRFRNGPTAERRTVREGGHTIRVVSLNCNVAQLRSAEEVGAWNPDLVLLQESPSSESLGALSQILYGEDGAFLHGGDVSILANGQIRPKFSDQSSHFVHAEVELANGFKTDVVSLRLSPPVFRFDFWTPGFWTDHRDRRIEHREQILDIMRHLKRLPATEHLMIGGDFNSPPHDKALAPLQQRLFDTFRKAGQGWGATGTNDYPLFRVDQIWVSEGFQAKSVTAQKTSFSDHRMVVCDLTVEE